MSSSRHEATTFWWSGWWWDLAWGAWGSGAVQAGIQDPNPWPQVWNLRHGELVFGSGVCPELFGAPNRDPDRVLGRTREVCIPPWKKQEEELSFKFGGNYFGKLRGKNLVKKKKSCMSSLSWDPFLTIHLIGLCLYSYWCLGLCLLFLCLVDKKISCWVCVCCFCVWLTRKICCWVCIYVSGFVIFGF